MNKKRKFLILSLFLCLSFSCIFGTESKAEGTSGEQTSSPSGTEDANRQRLETVTGMDEDGNVTELDESGGLVEDNGMAAYFRSAQPELVVNFRTKENAVTDYVEVGTGQSGYTNGAYGADAAYLGKTNEGKVKFMMSGVVGVVDAGDVQVVSKSSVKVVSCYVVSGGRLIHRVAQDMTTPGYATQLDNGPAPAYLSEGTTYYSYDGHYFYTDYGTMLADYQNNTRSQSVNANDPFYNYFQYLPMRSKTAYSGNELESMINSRTSGSSKMKNTGALFVNRQNTYGVNALLMSGIAANESAWGDSSIAMNKNNLFGLDAVDSSAGASASSYPTVDECIRQFANTWMSRWYLSPAYASSTYHGAFLGNKGSGANVSYASDPYWGEKAAAVAWKLDGAGGSRDYGAYTIGIKDTLPTSHSTVNVRSESSTESNILYNTGTHSNYAVLILDSNPNNSFYRIQSDAVLNPERTGIVSGTGEYSFDSMYAYISTGYVSIVNQGNNINMPEVKKELASIAVSTPPARTSYVEGDVFDASGMAVTAAWSDGSATDVTQEITFSQEPLVKDTKSITIQYTADGITKTVEQAITVQEKVTVTGIDITPVTVRLKPGESLVYGVLVKGTGTPSQSVAWNVEGASSAETAIDSTGKLTIGSDETAGTLTVKAVSVIDSSISKEGTVTIVKEEAPPSDQPGPDDSNTEQPDGEEPVLPNPEQAAEVKDENTGIKAAGTLPEGTALNVSAIGTEDGQYPVLTGIEQLKDKKVLGVYDIGLSTELEEGQEITLVFPVDESLEGKTVYIYHFVTQEALSAAEAPVQTLEAVVKSGEASVGVRGFSPFVIAEESASESVPEPDNQLTPPKEEAVTPAPPEENTVPSAPPANNGAVENGGNGQTAPSSGEKETGQEQQPKGEQAAPKEETKPEVKPAADNQNNQKKAPKTGDTNTAMAWMILLAASVLVLAGILLKIKKTKR